MNVAGMSSVNLVVFADVVSVVVRAVVHAVVERVVVCKEIDSDGQG